MRLLKILLGGLMTTFTTESLSLAVSKNVLKDVISFLLVSLYDSNLAQLEDWDVITKTYNIIMLKIVLHSDHTSCIW